MYQRDPKRPKIAQGPMAPQEVVKTAGNMQTVSAPQRTPTVGETLQNMAVNQVGNQAIDKGMKSGYNAVTSAEGPLSQGFAKVNAAMNPAAGAAAEQYGLNAAATQGGTWGGAALGEGSQAAMLAAQDAAFAEGAGALGAEAASTAAGTALAEGAGTALAGEAAAGTGAALAGGAGAGAMTALGTAMPWIGAGLLAAKAFGLFNNGGYVGPLAGIALKDLEKGKLPPMGALGLAAPLLK